MSYVKKQKLKDFFNRNQKQTLNEKTLKGVLRSIIEPLLEVNTPAIVLTKIVGTQGIEGILKRLEYKEEIKVYNLLKEQIFNDLDFIVVTSPRFSCAFVWSRENDVFEALIYVNSSLINEIFELVQNDIAEDLRKEFYKFKPERRENRILNEAIGRITGILNENIIENDFIQEENLKEQPQDFRELLHEVKNCISVIDINLKILEKTSGNNHLQIIRKNLDDIILKINKKNTDLNYEEINITDVIEKLTEQDKSINFKIKSPKNIFGNKKKFEEVLVNIIKNAKEAGAKKIDILLDKNQLAISNDGEKIPENLKDKIFEYNFSTKENGWGIGLFICKKYLNAMKCDLRLSQNSDKTEFQILF